MEKKKQYYSYQDNRELIIRFQSGDKSALDVLCRCNSGLVSKMAHRYAAATHLSYDDFYQEGMVGLIQSAKRFDPEMGTAFSTYATWYLFSKMQEYADSNFSIIRLPASILWHVRKAVSLNSAYTYLPQKERIDAIAREMQTTVQNVQYFFGIWYRFHHVVSLDTVTTDEDQNTYMEYIIAEANDFADEVSVRQAQKEVSDLLLCYLSPQELLVVQLRNGLTGEDPYTLDQVRKNHGISVERIKIFETRAYSHMRRAANWNRIVKNELLTDPQMYQQHL